MSPAPPGVPPPGSLDVTVDAIHVTQAVQTYAGSVPLVRGRAGLARVFLRANQPNALAPTVRLTLVDTGSGAALRTWDVPATSPGVPTAPSETPLAASWNTTLGAADLQPGRHLVAEVDPSGALGQPRGNDVARHPAAGSLDVRTVPALAVTIVPVSHSGTTPNVENAPRTAQSWLGTTLRLHPLSGADVQVGATYTTQLAVTNDSGVWGSLLGELRSKRSVDGSSRSYLGAVATSYSSGIAGIGYVGLPVAVSWDRSSYQATTAHELGHNFGRLHAPCGGPANPDPTWPSAAAYAGALIGAWGWDPASGALVDPRVAHDLMSYCNNSWVSDYTYAGVLGRISTSVSAALAAPALVREQCLLVSGRIVDGQVEIEPAFVVAAAPSLPAPGPYALHLLDARGALIAAVPFAPDLVEAEVPGDPDQRHFAFALPVSSGWARDLARLRVVERSTGLALPEAATAAPRRLTAPPSRPAALASWPGRAYLSWDAGAHRRALVVDPRTGELIATLRDGEAFVATDARELEVLLSDGIRTERRLLRAGP